MHLDTGNPLQLELYLCGLQCNNFPIDPPPTQSLSQAHRGQNLGLQLSEIRRIHQVQLGRHCLRVVYRRQQVPITFDRLDPAGDKTGS